MKLRHLMILATLVAVAVAASAVATKSSEDPRKGKDRAERFVAHLTPLNDSGVTGRVNLVEKNGRLVVRLRARGLERNQPHAQHIHGFGGGDQSPPAACPPPTAAGDDGVLEVGEGAPFYGPVQLSLTPFQMARNGRIHYRERFRATDEGDDLSAVLPLDRQAVVVHGATVDGEYVPSLPVACGVIRDPKADLGGEGIVTVPSAMSVDDTVARLTAAIEGAPGAGVAAVVDHTANAASVGEDLPPTKLIIFGNPAAGTPLIQAQRSIALDLPQKLLVWQDDDGNTQVTYNDPAYLAARHGIEGQDGRLANIAMTLRGLASGPAG